MFFLGCKHTYRVASMLALTKWRTVASRSGTRAVRREGQPSSGSTVNA
jgi:hypothetical protein